MKKSDMQREIDRLTMLTDNLSEQLAAKSWREEILPKIVRGQMWVRIDPDNRRFELPHIDDVEIVD